MRSITRIVVTSAAVVALTAIPLAAQHGGGHGGGGHSGGQSGGGHSGGQSGGGHSGGQSGGSHSGGGQNSGGHSTGRVAVPRGGDANGSSGRVATRQAVPRSYVAVHDNHHATHVDPYHYGHVSAFGVAFGPYAYPYGFGYAPLGYGYPAYYYPGAYHYPAYYNYPRYYGYSSGTYGGYVRGAQTRLRIIDAPPDAEIYVDGYYAGLVEDFDGVVQYLEVAPGPHQIEIRAPGFETVVFDLDGAEGRTITYRARMIPVRP